MRADTTFVRRVARVGPSLWLFLVVAVVVAALDSSTDAWHADTGASVFHVVTYTWNWYVQANLVSSRPDFGHLWYLSVDMQAFVIMAVPVLYLLRRRPVGLLLALGGFYLLLVWWRFHVVPHRARLPGAAAHHRADGPVRGRRADRRGAAPIWCDCGSPARAVGLTASAVAAALGAAALLVRPTTCPTCGWGGTVLEWDVAALLRRRRPGRNLALVDCGDGHPAGDLAGSQLAPALHLALPGLRVRRRGTPGATDGRGRRAPRSAPDDDGRDLRRGRPPPRAARSRSWLRRPAWRDLDDGVPHWLG